MADLKIIFQNTLLIRVMQEKEFLMCRYENFDMKILVSMNITVSCLNAPLFQVAKSELNMLIPPFEEKKILKNPKEN